MMEKLFIKNSKSQNLAITVHQPESDTGSLTILCPGYLDTKDYAHLMGLANILCSKGYTVVRFDPTGTWESEGDISEYNTTQYLADIQSVLDYMLSKKKYERIIIGGHSRGGQMSLLYGARDPRVSTVVAIMPSSGRTFSGKRTEEWKKNGFSISTRDIPNNIERKEFKVPYSHVEDRQKYDVFKEIKNMHVPVLFIAGEMDDLVLPQDVKDLFDQANEPKKFFLMKDIGHDYRHNASEIDYVNNHIVSFLEN